MFYLFHSANSISAGQLLCGGLFSPDPLSNWFASVALLHAIVEHATQKEQLLRVQLATSLGNPPVSLLQQCCNMLSQVLYYFIVVILKLFRLFYSPLHHLYMCFTTLIMQLPLTIDCSSIHFIWLIPP